MPIQIVPLDNWIVFKARPQQETAGLIALPEGADSNSFFPVLGDVLAAGPGRRTEDGTILPMRIKKGDVILLNGLTARRVTVEVGHDLAMLREHEVAALVLPAPPHEIHQAIFPTAVNN